MRLVFIKLNFHFLRVRICVDVIIVEPV